MPPEGDAVDHRQPGHRPFLDREQRLVPGVYEVAELGARCGQQLADVRARPEPDAIPNLVRELAHGSSPWPPSWPCESLDPRGRVVSSQLPELVEPAFGTARSS